MIVEKSSFSTIWYEKKLGCGVHCVFLYSNEISLFDLQLCIYNFELNTFMIFHRVVLLVSRSLHAVSRDQEAYPSPCIYAQISELRLVPEDHSQLDMLFGVFCECAELNPDPIEREQEHNWIFSAEQMVTDSAEVDDSEWNDVLAPTSSIGYSNGDNVLAHTVLQVDLCCWGLSFRIDVIL
ncbi:hypothetical protein DCAR_0726882 [Daucus carota subsp. sativus]|uniref:Uncharacterized protein n=1 Tax=Daucus carota subsp. sativus TaxID=79200 RepID=A0AAF0XHX0_DAUCS|nr:hypothetical protein DCAR_0726882 [Daucus carota subsp. sativus]